MSSSPPLALELLGSFRASDAAGVPLTFQTKKTQALLAFLACHAGEMHSREKLATLLWGDSGPDQARQSLRTTLFSLRRTLGEAAPLIRSEGDSVTIDPGLVAVDVLEFRAAARSGRPESLEKAAALYKGEFLEGLLVDVEAFDNWLLAERESLHEMMIVIEGKILEQRIVEGQFDGAVQTAFRILALDPLHEATHRRLMQIYLRRGRRESAIRQYHTCADLLRRRLGIQPDPETRRLYEEIMGGSGATETAATAAPKVPSVLLVEDNPLNRQLIRAIIAESPFELVIAEDGAQALLRLGQRSFDVILLDLNLPTLDGFTFIDVMRRNAYDTPIIVITASIDPEDEVRALEAGAADFMRKPIHADVLLKRIEKALRASRAQASA